MSFLPRVEVKDVVIVIPVYKTQISDLEWNVLRQCAKVLANYDIAVAHPEGLDLSVYKTIIPRLRSIPFEKRYFSNIAGYNKLLISDFFYQAFERYQFMLVFQLDAWVFEDSLLAWCNKGFDYIGAPWIEEPIPGKNSALIPLTKLCLNKVGNGGLSLRRVSAHLRIAKRLRGLVRYYHYNEDVFWSILVPMIFWSYRKPTVLEALSFAFEYKPRESYERIGNKLPFGCHAWERTDRLFWDQYIHVESR